MSALHYGPIPAAVDASSTAWILYQSGVLDSSSCSNTSINHAVLIVAYSDGSDNNGQPYYVVKNSQSQNWGINGYGKIAVETGVGACAIQAEAAIPALLLVSNNLQTAIIFILLGLTLFVMVPMSFYYWHAQKESLHFLHPGQLILKKMMWFELLYVVAGFVVMVLGETVTLNSWDIEQADIWMLLLCNHVD